MKCTADEATMLIRRQERLKHIEVFMCAKVKPEVSRMFTLSATHDLLTGFFQNSHWRTALYCLKKAVGYSWMEFTVTCQLFWYRRILRLSKEQIEERF